MSKLRAFLTTIGELPPAFKMCGALGLLGVLITWTIPVLWYFGSLLGVGALLYLNGWIRGYRKGGDTVFGIFIDRQVEAMKGVVERVNEDYAPDSPERVAAYKQLRDLERVQREIPR